MQARPSTLGPHLAPAGRNFVKPTCEYLTTEWMMAKGMPILAMPWNVAACRAVR